MTAPAHAKVVEDAVHHPRLVSDDCSGAGNRVVGVPVNPLPGALRQPTASRALCFAPHRALDDLLALDFGDERAGGEDEAPDSGVFGPLRHELQLRVRLLDLVKEHTDVVLVTRKPVDGIRNDDIYLAMAQHSAQRLDALTVEVISAGSIADRPHDRESLSCSELEARPLLRIE